MQEVYDPTKYCIDERRHDASHIEEVIIGSEQGTTFPTKVGTTVCNALIATSAARCCISEAYNRKLKLPEIQLLHDVSVRPATGSNLAPVGLVKCTFLLGDTPFEYSFIVCRNLTRPIILGRDFLVQNHIAVRYSDKGKCILDHQQHELVTAVKVEVKPHLVLGNSVTQEEPWQFYRWIAPSLKNRVVTCMKLNPITS